MFSIIEKKSRLKKLTNQDMKVEENWGPAAGKIVVRVKGDGHDRSL